MLFFCQEGYRCDLAVSGKGESELIHFLRLLQVSYLHSLTSTVQKVSERSQSTITDERIKASFPATFCVSSAAALTTDIRDGVYTVTTKAVLFASHTIRCEQIVFCSNLMALSAYNTSKNTLKAKKKQDTFIGNVTNN